jgi:uncharacterized protein DUF3995
VSSRSIVPAPSAPSQAAVRAAYWAFGWAVVFVALHIYWAFGGRIGFGDQVDPLPGLPTTVGGWIVSVVVDGMFIAGIAVPLALVRPWGARVPHRLLLALMWIGCAVLLARGGLGLLDGLLRSTGLADGGLTGQTSAQVLGDAHPSAYTLWSATAIDTIFLLGGLLFGRAAQQHTRRLAPR